MPATEKKHTTTMLRKKLIKRQTHYIERNQLLGAQVSQKKNPHTKITKSTLAVHIQWNQMLVHGTFSWYLPGIARYFKYKYILGTLIDKQQFLII